MMEYDMGSFASDDSLRCCQNSSDLSSKRAVEWINRKFEIHSKISDENVSITIDGKYLEGEEKIQVINSFNEAIFLERYVIFRGYEQSYLYPENAGTPLVIDTKRGKKDVRLYVYIYNDYVDVVKQYKKKVVAYRLLSDSLPKTFYKKTVLLKIVFQSINTN